MAPLPKFIFYFLLWLLVGTLVVALACLLDDRVDTALDVTRNLSWQPFAWWCSKLGEGWVPALAGVPLVILFFLLRRPVIAAKIFFVVLTCILTGGAGLVLRVLTGRTRPTADAPQGFYGVWHNGHWIIGQYEFSAFPSGHAATVVGLATAAWLLNRAWGVVASLYALIVIWSRIALQCHHLSDVVASAVLAIPLAILLKKFVLPSVEFQFIHLYRLWQKDYPPPARPQKSFVR
jgi:membrane-associated phospholipid phosphatase